MNEASPKSASASPLYTREILAAAMRLADFSTNNQLSVQNEMRSKTCGSVVNVTIALNGHLISDFGISAQACALGQASAAILAQHIKGRTLADIKIAEKRLSDYLYGRRDDAGDWPDIDMLKPAKDYPARRDSVLLPWQATIAAIITGGDI